MNAHDQKLASLGRRTLEILEQREEWNSDTADDIASFALEAGLAKTNNEGMFKTVPSSGETENPPPRARPRMKH